MRHLFGCAIILAAMQAVCCRAESAVDPSIPSPKPVISACVFPDVGRVEFEPPPTPGLTIRYTIDGTMPNEKSPACSNYRAAISLTLRAAYFSADGKYSAPVSVDCASYQDENLPDLEPGVFATTAEGTREAPLVISTVPGAILKKAPDFDSDAFKGKGPFAVQFDAYIKIPKDGAYTFSIPGAGQKTLRIAGARVIGNEGLSPESGSVQLKAGTYPIQVLFVETGDTAAPVVSIEGPELAKQKIPTSMLFRSTKMQPLVGLSVSTNLPLFGKKYAPQLALDRSAGTFFFSSRGTKESDSFNVTFAEPFALTEVEIISGKPDGDCHIEKAALEISEDGTKFTEAAKFTAGTCRATFEGAGKTVKALRIHFGEQGSFVAIREINLNSHTPALTGKPSAAINVDYSETPDLAEWALRAQKDAEEQFPIIAERLHSDGFVPPRQIMMFFKKDMKGIAHTIGARMYYAEGWIKANPKDHGTVIHELTHVIQQYHNAPGWLTEGVADYIRWWNWEPAANRGRINPRSAKYTNGYQDAAAFLVWIEKTYDKELVYKMNKAMREGAYKDSLFVEYTGKDIPTLWKEFLDSFDKK